MKKNKIFNAFTLVELIVGVTISLILMLSVSIFISSGMQNILSQQKVLESSDGFNEFINRINTNFNLISSGAFSSVITSSGIIFKNGINFSEGGFAYIGEETLSGVFCDSGSETPETKSLFIKNFIPFEEQGENIFSNYSKILTGSTVGYISYQNEHVIKDISGNIIVGKGIFGDTFEEGVNGTGIYLNSPTGLAYDGTNLYISDTLNNRILYLDSTNKIHKLLDETDGLNEPTGLYYNNNSLYIANSGKGEILKYSSESNTTSPTLTMSGFNINNVNKVEITFSGASSNLRLSSYSTISFTFTDSTSSTDFLTGSSNRLKYYFINYNSNSNQPSCSSNEIDLVSDNPIQCVSSGTGKTSSYQNKTISQIVINNIINTSNTGTYFIDLKLLDSNNNILYRNFFPYFTQSDNNLTTPNDNTLSVYTGGLNYPTGIWGTGSTDFNQFGDGSYQNMNYNKEYDTLLNIPISSLTINNSNNLLTMILKYYKVYDCYNSENKTERTYITKKNIPK